MNNTNTNELIFVNNILTTKITIRKAAKQLGLRRDDLIEKIKNIIKDDKENIEKLDLIIITNKIIYGKLKIKKAASMLRLTERELDLKILELLSKNQNKKNKYEYIRKKYFEDI